MALPLPVTASPSSEIRARKLSKALDPEVLQDDNGSVIHKHRMFNYGVSLSSLLPSKLPTKHWTTTDEEHQTEDERVFKIVCRNNLTETVVEFEFKFPPTLRPKTPAYVSKKVGVTRRNFFSVGLHLDGDTPRNKTSFLRVSVRVDNTQVATGVFEIKSKLTSGPTKRNNGPRFDPFQQPATGLILLPQEGEMALNAGEEDILSFFSWINSNNVAGI